MSYNILCDGLDTQKNHPNTSQEILAFSFRAPRIVQEISQSEAGIICLQEVNHAGPPEKEHSSFYKDHLENLGFQLICYKPHDFFTEDRIIIAIKTREFTLLDTKFIDLNDIVKLYKNQKYFNWGNYFMLCLLQHNKTKKKIVVGNTHLVSTAAQDFAKFASSHYLLLKAAEYLRKWSDQPLPFILCGDMNSDPCSSALSAFYGEDIEDANRSQWTIPVELSDKTKIRGN